MTSGDELGMKSNYIITRPIILNLLKYQSYYIKYKNTLNQIVQSEIYEKLESNTLDIEHIYYDIKPKNWTNKKDTKLIKRLYSLAVRLYAEIKYDFPLSNLYLQRSLEDIKITDRPTRLPNGEPCDQIKDIETALYFLVESGQLIIIRKSYKVDGEVFIFCKPTVRVLVDTKELFKKNNKIKSLEKRMSKRKLKRENK